MMEEYMAITKNMDVISDIVAKSWPKEFGGKEERWRWDMPNLTFYWKREADGLEFKIDFAFYGPAVYGCSLAMWHDDNDRGLRRMHGLGFGVFKIEEAQDRIPILLDRAFAQAARTTTANLTEMATLPPHPRDPGRITDQ